MNVRFSSISNWLLTGLFAVTAGTLAVRADSVWRSESNRSMFSDKSAHAVGDIVTILVQESSTASKDNKTATAKKSAIDASINTFLYSPAGSGFMTHNGKMPAINTTAQTDFGGGGSINNSEKIIAKISVQVVDVLPNNNLVIEGKRRTSFSGETQEIVLRGVVRQEDVTANNNVFSFNVADASVSFINKGTVADSQRKGWFTRIWDKVTPF